MPVRIEFAGEYAPLMGDYVAFRQSLGFVMPESSQRTLLHMAEFLHAMPPVPEVIDRERAEGIAARRGDESERTRQGRFVVLRQFCLYLNLDEASKLQSVVKLVFAYSEDVLISPRVGDAVLKDESLVRLARMNSTYQGYGDSFSSYNRAAAETALREYAINALPNPPELLSKEYALSVLHPLGRN